MSDSSGSSVSSKDEIDSFWPSATRTKHKDKSKSSNVNRIISLFEIPRPNKHIPNSKVKYEKQKSIDFTSERQGAFVKSKKTRSNSVSSIVPESELEFGKVKKIAAKLEKNKENTYSRATSKLDKSHVKNQNTSEIQGNPEGYQKDKLIYYPLSINNTTNDDNLENSFVICRNDEFIDQDNAGNQSSYSSTIERKFTKNSEINKRSSYRRKKKNAIQSRIESQKYQVESERTGPKSSEYPEEDNEYEVFENTESYRQGLIRQMDKVMAKMKEDGFIIDHNNTETGNNCYENTEEAEYYEILEEPIYENILPKNGKPNYDFGETQFNEDLEQGLYFVEAYNIDDKELVIVSMQVDRKSVHFNSIGEMKEIVSDSDLHFHQNNDQTLVLINDSTSNIKHNSSASSGNYSMDEVNSSQRNTIYSTTSGDSFEDFDEGIDLENPNSYSYNSARRETYCDNNGVIRIERVGYPENVHENTPSATEENEGPPAEIVHESKNKLDYIIEEIKATERKYVTDLSKVIYEYKPFIEKHPLSQFLGNVKHIFGNIEVLYKHQKVLLEALEKSDDKVDSTIQLFIEFEYLFKIYPVYFKSKPRAEIAIKEFTPIIQERQEQLNDRLDLSSYLLTPLQRLGRYKLFLESIHKQLEKDNKPTRNVLKALDIIRREMSKGNDVIAIESIFHSPLKNNEYGSFIRREKFTCLKPKKIDLMVFLFESVIIFTTEDPRNMEIYNYWESIKTNDLRIATFEDSTIHLTDYTRTKRKNSGKYNYILDAKSVKLRELWRKDIEDILWQQLKNAKENTLKLYKREKYKAQVTIPRIKSTGSSVFYVSE